MPESNAWLLTITEDSHAAIGNLEMVHINPEIPVLIPRLNEASYCQHKILWQEQHLPLLDVGLFLYGNPSNDKKSDTHQSLFLCVVAYMSEQKNMQEYGAILSSKLPERIKVDDKQACELPDSPEKWSMLAISCFSHDNYGTVPILDLPRIFSTQVDGTLADSDG